MPIMPKDASCSDCEHWYWYADRCGSYHGNCPHKQGCNRFKIKTHSEAGFEHYNPLPDKAIVKEYYRLNPKAIKKQTKRAGE